MIIAANIKRFLNQYKLSYQVFSHERTVTLVDAQQSLQIASKMFARAVILHDNHGLVLVILPLDHKIDFNLLNKRLKRHLNLVTGTKADRVFYDCEPGSHPILGEPYGIKKIVVAQCLSRVPYVYFEPGSHTNIVRLTQADFRFIHANAIWANISVPIEHEEQSCHWEHSQSLVQRLTNIHKPNSDYICEGIKTKYPLPPLPDLAQSILTQSCGESCQGSLRQFIKQDPNVAQWLMNYAAQLTDSPLHQVDDLFDLIPTPIIEHLAVGVVCGRVFQVQQSGPLGLHAFWRHAFSCAALAQQLSLKATKKQLDPNKAFMCGLMHNFGLLLFAHLFKPEFRLLNNLVKMNPHSPIELLERKILGMGQARHVMQIGHACLGAWLLRSWGMPPEVIQCAASHHQIHYGGEHEGYVRLIYMVNAILKGVEIGEGDCTELEHLDLDDFGLNANIIQQQLETILPILHQEKQPLVGIAR